MNRIWTVKEIERKKLDRKDDNNTKHRKEIHPPPAHKHCDKGKQTKPFKTVSTLLAYSGFLICQEYLLGFQLKLVGSTWGKKTVHPPHADDNKQSRIR